ncbi:hypothetical protein HDV57DRAFT_498885 [Trichoderma longibrachiatum]|uniref:Uncharacterized protein n=1 Tax=Trichoderma longibrachiatum ATCC 18648 TaxID=983965 RepID=A0A2T4C921_TRILO|nr:hypothetical protein M440DRAFT_1183905 [Trichoderma longibrachiatum ATCC 18648]
MKRKRQRWQALLLALFTLACPLHSRAKTQSSALYKEDVEMFWDTPESFIAGICSHLLHILAVFFFWYLEGLCIYTAICCLFPLLEEEISLFSFDGGIF